MGEVALKARPLPKLVVEPVPSFRVPIMLPEIGHLLDEIVKLYDWRFTIDDLVMWIVAKDMQLFLARETGHGNEYVAAMVTKLVPWPGGLEISIVGMAGSEMGRLLPLIEQIKEFGRSKGCREIQGFARPAIAAKTGWKKGGVMIWQPLEPEA